MSTVPPFFTKARKRQAGLLTLVFALLFGLTSLWNYLQTRHKYVDTHGMIVFSSDQGSPGHPHIFLIKGDGTGLKQLTTGNEDDISPSFSPDGSSITFISDKSGTNQVFVMDAAASQINQISTGDDSKANPIFTPDGNSVGYLSRGQIITTDVASLISNLVYPQSTSPSSDNSGGEEDVQEKAPVSEFAWSSSKTPSGYNLAAIQSQPDSGIQTLVMVPADSSQKPVNMFAADKLSIAWNRDGTKLAAAALGVAIFDPKKHNFATQPVSGIALFNADGSIVAQPLLSHAPSADTGPQNVAWSADGTQMGFDIYEVNKIGQVLQGGIGLNNLDPSTAPKVVAPPGAHSIGFSPDGKMALFLGPGISAHSENLYVVNMSTGQINDVTRNAGTVASAQWSPALAKK